MKVVILSLYLLICVSSVFSDIDPLVKEFKIESDTNSLKTTNGIYKIEMEKNLLPIEKIIVEMQIENLKFDKIKSISTPEKCPLQILKWIKKVNITPSDTEIIQLYFNISYTNSQFVLLNIISKDSDILYPFQFFFYVNNQIPQNISEKPIYFQYNSINEINLKGINNANNVRKLYIKGGNNIKLLNTKIIDNLSLNLTIDFGKEADIDLKHYSIVGESNNIDERGIYEYFTLINDLSKIFYVSTTAISNENVLYILDDIPITNLISYPEKKDITLRAKLPEFVTQPNLSTNLANVEIKSDGKFNDSYSYKVSIPANVPTGNYKWEFSDSIFKIEKKSIDFTIIPFNFPVESENIAIKFYNDSSYQKIDDYLKKYEYSKETSGMWFKIDKNLINGKQFYKLTGTIYDENNSPIELREMINNYDPKDSEDFIINYKFINSKNGESVVIKEWFLITISLTPIFEYYKTKDFLKDKNINKYKFEKSFLFRDKYELFGFGPTLGYYRVYPIVNLFSYNVSSISRKHPISSLLNIGIGGILRKVNNNGLINKKLAFGTGLYLSNLSNAFTTDSARSFGVNIELILSWNITDNFPLTILSGPGLYWYQKEQAIFQWNFAFAINSSLAGIF